MSVFHTQHEKIGRAPNNLRKVEAQAETDTRTITEYLAEMTGKVSKLKPKKQASEHRMGA